MFGFIQDISAAITAGSQIFTLLDSTPRIEADSASGEKVSENVQGSIRLANVHFNYPTRPGLLCLPTDAWYLLDANIVKSDVPVLRGLNLTVKPGTYVALVGASGCGKSTM
jgi:ATP-binding cassette, subfamily B (MDR/TAP), member 1